MAFYDSITNLLGGNRLRVCGGSGRLSLEWRQPGHQPAQPQVEEDEAHLRETHLKAHIIINFSYLVEFPLTAGSQNTYLDV